MTLILFLTTALLHPVHETVAEVEWNASTGRLEVALRLDPLDEQWLARNVRGQKVRGKKVDGKKVDGKKVDGQDDTSTWAIDYLAKHFRVAPSASELSAPQKTTAKYHWIGRDDKVSHVWWYFEIETATGKRPRWIDQRILLQRNSHHVNRILILGEVPRRALTLTIQRPQATLYQASHEPATPPDPDSRSRLDRR
jgi:hypothetical protein